MQAPARRRRGGGSAVVLLFALAIMPTPPAAGAPQSGEPMQAARVKVGDEAIDFTLTSIDGETYQLGDLRGEKNAIIIFFRGTW